MNKWVVVAIIFTFSVILRLWNLNQMGKTWDEQFYVDQGYRFIELAKKLNFKDAYWYKDPDPPPVAKYLFGIAEHLNIGKIIPCNDQLCSYDLTSSRLMSVIFSSFSIAIVVLIGLEYISPLVGITAGIIFSTLPIFLGLSQLATIEGALTFFFTATIYSFLKLLERFSVNKIIITGILLGLAIGTKYTNGILIPLLLAIYAIWYFNYRKEKPKININFIYIFLISIITFIIVWPSAFLNINEVLEKIYSIRFSETANHPPPEVFMGRLMPVPIFYYSLYFFITTPFLVIILFLIGFRQMFNKKKWISHSIFIWFLMPFFQSLLNFKQHGLRYIIEVYAPLSLIAAIGFSALVSIFTKKIKLQLLIFIPIFIILFIPLYKISPYYLDYFNVIVGGTRGVYDGRSFQIGWWGQGMREAGKFIIRDAKPNAKIGLAISPITSFPNISGLNISKYEESKKYDYVVVNYYNILREKYDDSKIKAIYKPVYYVKADGAGLVTIYKHK